MNDLYRKKSFPTEVIFQYRASVNNGLSTYHCDKDKFNYL